jgi:tRNA (guanosine-2'-O-)-methyltransferase
LHDLGNVAAVCRTAEALGYGAMHLVHEQHMESYKRSRRSSAGAEKWSELHRWSDSKVCLTTLKSAGYRILVRRPLPTLAQVCKRIEFRSSSNSL